MALLIEVGEDVGGGTPVKQAGLGTTTVPAFGSVIVTPAQLVVVAVLIPVACDVGVLLADVDVGVEPVLFVVDVRLDVGLGLVAVEEVLLVGDVDGGRDVVLEPPVLDVEVLLVPWVVDDEVFAVVELEPVLEFVEVGDGALLVDEVVTVEKMAAPPAIGSPPSAVFDRRRHSCIRSS